MTINIKDISEKGPQHSPGLTATKLKRTLDMNDAIFDESADYGYTNKFFAWNTNQVYAS
ncbi:hypothetical protein [Sinorhizobium fredii]|uniref:hypothetical protein n=1 Tax=Rhizobium fredii TaxID=380 RepID=UPI0013E8A98E|nr:hypothetical protein [Sinorhizobium fredii]